MGLLVLQTGWKGYSWEMQTGVRVGCVAATGVAIGGDDDAAAGIYKERNGVEKPEEEQQQLLRQSSSSGAWCCTVWGLSGVVAQQQHVPLRGVGWLRLNSSRAALR
ncbi:hypothetical protein F0562_025593 [Nyssa sinensis]|uniref:Uncharacterized protein n=1 Tax=Nyssa sinensis TaxID=561372 RepID=A0A5J5BCF8_9ASTE|nr:hypothetical protein F0562_025593 [Nyssa sinensis]